MAAVLDGAVDSGLQWTAIVPVKGFHMAKSRLRRADIPTDRLARAFLADMLAALTSVASITDVLVATHDPDVGAVAAASGATVIDDQEHPGINAAAVHAAATRAPRTGVAILVSDLPCLTPAATARALSLGAQHRRSFLPDQDGTGTTMWLSPSGEGLPSSFGPQSRQAHTAAGVVDLVLAHPESAAALLPARLDVDTEAALEIALTHGVGERTASVLAP